MDARHNLTRQLFALTCLAFYSAAQGQELPGPTSHGQSPINPPTAPNQVPNTGEASAPGTPALTPSTGTAEQTIAPIVVTGSLIPTTDAESAETGDGH